MQTLIRDTIENYKFDLAHAENRYYTNTTNSNIIDF